MIRYRPASHKKTAEIALARGPQDFEVDVCTDCAPCFPPSPAALKQREAQAACRDTHPIIQPAPGTVCGAAGTVPLRAAGTGPSRPPPAAPDPPFCSAALQLQEGAIVTPLPRMIAAAEFNVARVVAAGLLNQQQRGTLRAHGQGKKTRCILLAAMPAGTPLAWAPRFCGCGRARLSRCACR